MNKELLKTELLASPFKTLISKDLVEEDEIVVILLSGSQTSGLATDQSDIDIAVKTLKSWNLNSLIKGEFQGIHLHWWLSPLIAGEVAWVDPKHMGLILVGQYYMDYTPDNILYINSKYKKVVQYIQEHKNIIKIASLYHLVLYLNPEIQFWSLEKPFRCSKLMLPLIDFYYEKNNLDRNIELLTKIKKSIKDRTIELTSEEWNEVRQGLFWTLDYTKKNEFPIVDYLNYYQGLTLLIKECQENPE